MVQMTEENEECKDDGFEDWKASLSTPSEKGSEIDEDDKLLSSDDKMPQGADNLFEEWGSDLAEGGTNSASSWRRGR